MESRKKRVSEPKSDLLRIPKSNVAPPIGTGPEERKRRTAKASRSEETNKGGSFPTQAATRKKENEPMLVNERLNYFLDIRGSVAKHSTNTTQILINLVRSGVPKSAYDRMLTETGLPANELADILRISERTLRRYTPKETLPAEQSERIVELASIYSRGEEVFGSLERFKNWMSRPQIAFGAVLPTTLLDTSLGIGMISDELGRIEHGIFA